MENWKTVNENNISIFFLFNKYFWKSISGPILAVFLPFLFLIVNFLISIIIKQFSLFVYGIPSYLVLSIFPLNLLILPALNIEFRNSIILRKIKSLNFSKYDYLTLLSIYFIAISITFVSINLLIFFIFSTYDISILEKIEWGGLIYNIFLSIILSMFFGIFMSTFIKNLITSQLAGITIMIISLLFGGQFVNISIMYRVDTIKYIGLLSPLSYGLNLMNISCDINDASTFQENYGPIFDQWIDKLEFPSKNIFDINSPYFLYYVKMENITSNPFVKVNVYETWQKAVYLIFPYLFLAIFIYFSNKNFKWINR